jgi:hypothetical protein
MASNAHAQDAVKLMQPGAMLTASPVAPPGAAPVTDALAMPAQALLDRAKRIRADFARNKQALADLNPKTSSAKVDALRAEKEADLAEFRSGQFCSGCGLTRSQILAKGERFPHPGQEIVMPTQAQIDARAGSWDARIDVAEQERLAAIAQMIRLEKAQNQLKEESGRVVVEWRLAMLREDDLRAKEWDNRLNEFRKDYENTKQTISKATQQLSALEAQKPPPSQLITAVKAQRDLSRGHMHQLSERAEADFYAHERQLSEFNGDLARGRAELSDMLSETGGPFLIMPTLPTAAGPLPSGFSASMGSESLGLEGQLGLFRASLLASGDWLRGTLQLNVSLSVGLPVLGTYGVGIEQTTTYGPGGATTTTAPKVQAGDTRQPSVIDLMTGGTKQ